MEYILMAVSIAFSVGSSCLLRDFGNKELTDKNGGIFLFNAYISVVWAIILGAKWALSGARLSGGGLVYGTVYGVILALFLLTKTKSLALGPVSLTTLIGSSAFIPTVIFGVVYAHDGINAVKVIGMALLLVSLILFINPKKSGEKLTARWFLMAFLFFVAGGAVGIFYRVFGLSAFSGETDGVMMTASIVSAVLFAATAFILNCAKKEPAPSVKKGALFYVVFCGIMSVVYQRLNLSLSGVIPGVIFFPVSNGSMVILSAVSGRIFFGEKLKKVQLFGIILGLIAIVTVGLG